MRKGKVLLSVTGISQSPFQGNDAMHMVTTGELTGGDGLWRLHYRETPPDSEESTDVTVALDQDAVTLQRDTACMVFKKGSLFQGLYDTPEGTVDMSLYPTHVHYRVGRDKGEVTLRYQLDIEGQFASMQELRIRFIPKGRA